MAVNQDVKARLIEFVSSLKISKAEFERRAGLSNGYLKNFKGNLGADKLEGLLRSFPSLSRIWLLTGEGEMLNSKGNDEGHVGAPAADDGSDEKFYTYLLPVAALGGQLSGFDCQSVMPQDCERVISPVAGVDFAMPVIGDSMEPEYPSGSRVMVKRIFPDAFISWGNVFVLDTTNGPLIKEVQPSELGDNYIRCISHNPSGRYKPFDVPLASVRAMYRVVACVSLK